MGPSINHEDRFLCILDPSSHIFSPSWFLDAHYWLPLLLNWAKFLKLNYFQFLFWSNSKLLLMQQGLSDWFCSVDSWSLDVFLEKYCVLIDTLRVIFQTLKLSFWRTFIKLDWRQKLPKIEDLQGWCISWSKVMRKPLNFSKN